MSTYILSEIILWVCTIGGLFIIYYDEYYGTNLWMYAVVLLFIQFASICSVLLEETVTS